jgi:hypothetical protein
LVAKFQFDHVERGDPLALGQRQRERDRSSRFPGTDAAREALERFPPLAKSRFLAGGLVVGRSMTEHPAA